ncbi:MAG: TIGR02147 family protein [Proteobacteria bacterium]|nr:MAG: TIGR02147 family protein [Pseudomonadota bacterium]
MQLEIEKLSTEGDKRATSTYPLIHQYSSYRDFIRDAYLYRRSVKAGFSMRRFAQLAGLKSPNYLQLVIDSKKNLTRETASSVASALTLKGAEKDLFLSLVDSENAKTSSERLQAEKAKLSALRKIHGKIIPSAQSVVLTRWYHLLVRELVLLTDFKPTGSWISARLGGLITSKEAQESLELLLKTGFVTENNGSYAVAEPVLSTEGGDFQHVFMQRHHAETLAMWSTQIERLSPAEQELGLLNIPISESKIPELAKKIKQFQDEIIGWVQDEKSADRVVQVGVYLMPFPGLKP